MAVLDSNSWPFLFNLEPAHRCDIDGRVCVTSRLLSSGIDCETPLGLTIDSVAFQCCGRHIVAGTVGKPRPNDPTRPVTTLKTAWQNLRDKAKVTGRWQDNRNALATELAESGASDQIIMDIAGHVSKQMLKHYSHIRMEAK